MNRAALPALSGPDAVPRVSDFSLATVALVAAVGLVYLSGAFLLADVFGNKRLIQVVLTLPLALMAMYYWVTQPARLVDPLVAFVVLRIVTELLMRGELVWLLDGVVSLLALTVILAAPRASFERALRVLVTFVGVLAFMALVQGITLFFLPYLGRYGMTVSYETNTLDAVIKHPIALLGLFSEQQFTLFGQTVARFQSFAREPSLNVVYFLIPAALAFIVQSSIARISGTIILLFCLMSLSGSIYLSLGFAMAWVVVLYIVPLRTALTFGLPFLVGSYIFAIRVFGLGPLFDVVSRAAQYGDFFQKQVSFETRANGADVTVNTALGSPFGAAVHPEVPGPWFINSVLEAGWLGALALVWFLVKFAGRLQDFETSLPRISFDRLGVLLLLGAFSTIMTFNDYQMSNYAGMVLLAFVYRQLLERRPETAG